MPRIPCELQHVVYHECIPRVSTPSPYSRSFTTDSLTIAASDAVSTPQPEPVKRELFSPAPPPAATQKAAATATQMALHKAKEYLLKRGGIPPAPAVPKVGPVTAAVPAQASLKTVSAGWLVPAPPPRLKHEAASPEHANSCRQHHARLWYCKRRKCLLHARLCRL